MESDQESASADTLIHDILTGIHEWRLQHPRATLGEIEAALDERWYQARARLLEALALQSSTTDWQTRVSAQAPLCPDCSGPLIRRGRQPRHLKTHGGQDITLIRTYGYCPKCNKGHFPPR